MAWARVTLRRERNGRGRSRNCPLGNRLFDTGMIASDGGGIVQFVVMRRTLLESFLGYYICFHKVIKTDSVWLPKSM